MFSSPTGVKSTDIGLLRLQSQERLQKAWEGLFDKYGRDFEDADEIDISTGEIVVDRGHLRSIKDVYVGDFVDDDEEYVEPEEGEEEGGDGEVEGDVDLELDGDSGALILYDGGTVLPEGYTSSIWDELSKTKERLMKSRSVSDTVSPTLRKTKGNTITDSKRKNRKSIIKPSKSTSFTTTDDDDDDGLDNAWSGPSSISKTSMILLEKRPSSLTTPSPSSSISSSQIVTSNNKNIISTPSTRNLKPVVGSPASGASSSSSCKSVVHVGLCSIPEEEVDDEFDMFESKERELRESGAGELVVWNGGNGGGGGDEKELDRDVPGSTEIEQDFEHENMDHDRYEPDGVDIDVDQFDEKDDKENLIGDGALVLVKSLKVTDYKASSNGVRYQVELPRDDKRGHGRPRKGSNIGSTADSYDEVDRRTSSNKSDNGGASMSTSISTASSPATASSSSGGNPSVSKSPQQHLPQLPSTRNPKSHIRPKKPVSKKGSQDPLITPMHSIPTAVPPTTPHARKIAAFTHAPVMSSPLRQSSVVPEDLDEEEDEEAADVFRLSPVEEGVVVQDLDEEDVVGVDLEDVEIGSARGRRVKEVGGDRGGGDGGGDGGSGEMEGVEVAMDTK
ncbi:hypothetical protein HDU76_009664, partial [Blyttiomyces sp. JEL0837]